MVGQKLLRHKNKRRLHKQVGSDTCTSLKTMRIIPLHPPYWNVLAHLTNCQVLHCSLCKSTVTNVQGKSRELRKSSVVQQIIPTIGSLLDGYGRYLHLKYLPYNHSVLLAMKQNIYICNAIGNAMSTVVN